MRYHPRVRSKNKLMLAVDDIQATMIVPHCRDCSNPCCNFEQLALELDWPRVQKLYQIRRTRAAFDLSLHEDNAVPGLTESHGSYYLHGRPCNAYVDKQCSVYGTALKPDACSDFPFSVANDVATADRRCEAVHVDAIHDALVAAMGRPMTRTVDEHHPMYVSFKLAR
jgi:Fe-S-cluster containining protein